MDTLRFITCGSVDDGKSTLIGRLLYETKLIFEDQLEALKADSKKFGTQGERLDFALLVDGLQAEREQGITIDVAYRFFATPKRRFIVADTPGHEQYTRNMATGASTAQAAVLLIDARKGVLTQTKRHSRIVSMLGIRHVALAVNKMDLVEWSQADLRRNRARLSSLCPGSRVSKRSRQSRCQRSRVTTSSTRATPPCPGTKGRLFCIGLKRFPSRSNMRAARPFTMPVQWVNRPNLDFRGFSGRIASGSIKSGDSVRISPSGVASTVKRNRCLRTAPRPIATAGQSITLVLEDEVDASRGDVIATAAHPIECRRPVRGGAPVDERACPVARAVPMPR